MVRKIKPTTRIIQRWAEETSMVLRDCFETTDWEVLCKSHVEDIDSLTHCITDYIHFCVENIVPSKKFRCYSNNKPWVTRDLRALLNKKKRAFRSGDKESLKTVQKELKREIRRGKTSYRRRLEKQLKRGNTKEIWRSLRTISGLGGNSGRGPESGDDEWANELNQFFNRFSPAPAPLTPQTRSNSTPLFSSSSPLPPLFHRSLHHCRSGDKTTKEDRGKEGYRSRQPQLQTTERVCGSAWHSDSAYFQPQPQSAEGPQLVENFLCGPSPKDCKPKGAKPLQAGSTNLSPA
ncbi:uncharacterized protein LOC144193233 [Stigmatopora nigra]